MGPLDVYTDQESDRLSRIMVNDPHAAANELRDQLQQLDPITASQLIQKTKDNEFVGGSSLGDLQIQVEFTQNGCDSGFRNVTMATPDGVEQIAEIQTNGGSCGPNGNGYDSGYYAGNPGNPLAYAARIIVGDLLWGQRNGYDFNDPRYNGWYQRQEYREQDWQAHNDEFRQNWSNPNYRNQYQDQPWQQNAWHQNNTYITNNRVDNTTINETIINNNGTNGRNQQPGGRPIYSNPGHGPITYAPGTPGVGQGGQGGYRPGEPIAVAPRPIAPHPVIGGQPRTEIYPQQQQQQQLEIQQQLHQQEVEQLRQHQHPVEIQQQQQQLRQQDHQLEVQQLRTHQPAEAPRQIAQPQQRVMPPQPNQHR